jgi:PadR family transcriptional regulator, regulatory protein PadR
MVERSSGGQGGNPDEQLRKSLTNQVYIYRLSEMKLRLSPQTLTVLDALLAQPREWQYGYDISRSTSLKSGTLYPILMRLADRKLLETRWEAAEPGKPPRHMYRFTQEGLRFARANARTHAGGLRRVALNQEIA